MATSVPDRILVSARLTQRDWMCLWEYAGRHTFKTQVLNI